MPSTAIAVARQDGFQTRRAPSGKRDPPRLEQPAASAQRPLLQAAAIILRGTLKTIRLRAGREGQEVVHIVQPAKVRGEFVGETQPAARMLQAAQQERLIVQVLDCLAEPVQATG